MTPTDADRALAWEWWLRDADSEEECIEHLAVFRARARDEGAEAMREKAARECDNEIARAFGDNAERSCVRLAAAIRALPTGEGS